jgi:predicted membrane protein
MDLGSNLCLLGFTDGVVHGRGFESLNFWGQWWCLLRGHGFENLDFWRVNGGVVHGLGFKTLSFGCLMVV